ncbi:hypothetical protein PspLS_04102 [Pyricularia sp. CBS 133598]|nr:hypothetical protein PspLS_04102 [Pyricularia sp. CBS 133598]
MAASNTTTTSGTTSQTTITTILNNTPTNGGPFISAPTPSPSSTAPGVFPTCPADAIPYSKDWKRERIVCYSRYREDEVGSVTSRRMQTCCGNDSIVAIAFSQTPVLVQSTLEGVFNWTCLHVCNVTDKAINYTDGVTYEESRAIQQCQITGLGNDTEVLRWPDVLCSDGLEKSKGVGREQVSVLPSCQLVECGRIITYVSRWLFIMSTTTVTSVATISSTTLQTTSSTTSTSTGLACPATAIPNAEYAWRKERIPCYSPYREDELASNVTERMRECCGGSQVIVANYAPGLAAGFPSRRGCLFMCNVSETAINYRNGVDDVEMFGILNCVYRSSNGSRSLEMDINCAPMLRSGAERRLISAGGLVTVSLVAFSLLMA